MVYTVLRWFSVCALSPSAGSCRHGAEVRVNPWMANYTPAVHRHHDKLLPTTGSAIAAVYLSPCWRRAPGPWLCCHGDLVASNSHHGNFQDVPRLCRPRHGLHDPPDYYLLGWCWSLPPVFAHSCLARPQNPTPPSCPAAASNLPNPVFPVWHWCLR